jgi:RNA polymerase sigma factor (TIGR02999 family)
MDDIPEKPDEGEITRMLERIQAGDGSVADHLLPLVYDELRARARRYLRSGRPGDTLQPTALVHEAYLRLVGRPPDGWQGRTHFFAVAAIAMRQILLDHAKHHGREKRGGGMQRVTLEDAVAPTTGPDVDLLALGQALERLAALSERQARIVELRFFGGLTVEEIAEVLGVSKRTVEGDWTFAKAWLRAELSKGGGA